MEKLYLCNKCGEEKTKNGFYENSRKFKNPKNGRDGLATICKKCQLKSNRQYQKDNKDKYNKYSKKWNLKNPDKRKKISFDFRKSPKGIYIKLKKRGNCCIEQEEFLRWYVKQERVCYYCGVDEETARKSKHPLNCRLNIDRKDNDRGYELDNICLSCGWCNRIKTNILTEEEMKYVGKNFVLNKYNKL